ncbi:MAG: hypothetical protein IJS50_03755 [Desulfovibrio sp.]|nr:hypothetical protein [Desulfovibrio sp.]
MSHKVLFIDPFGLEFMRYTFRNRCDQYTSHTLQDKATCIFLNAKDTRSEEHPVTFVASLTT